MKVIKAAKWLFLFLGLVSLVALGLVVVIGGKPDTLLAVWKFTENFMLNVLVVASPLLLCLASFMGWIQVKKRGYGGKRLPLMLTLVFLAATAFSALAFRMKCLDESLEKLKSPDGSHTLYYISGENGEDRIVPIYRRNNFFIYERLFYIGDDSFDDIIWRADGAENSGTLFDYSEYGD